MCTIHFCQIKECAEKYCKHGGEYDLFNPCKNVKKVFPFRLRKIYTLLQMILRTERKFVINGNYAILS